jgi:hypothetical protein
MQLTLILFFSLAAPKAEAAIALRSKSFTWSASSTSSITPTEPTGAAQGDILIMFVLLNNNVGMSTSAEWNDITAQFLGNNGIKIGLFWARRGTSAPSYALSLSGATSYHEVSVTAWSGVLASGSPFGTPAKSTQSRNPPNPDCPSITVGSANSAVLAFGVSWAGWNTVATAPTGYTIAEGGISGTHNDIAVAYLIKSTTGTENPPAFSGTWGIASETTVEITVEMQAAAVAKVKHKVISM